MKEIAKRVMTDVRAYYRGVLLAAAYLGITSLSGIPVCPMVLLTGLPCPGCGMTRAALLFLKGRWRQAWQMHPFFYVLLLLVVAVILSRYILGRSITGMRWAILAVLVLAIAFYVYRMIKYFPDQEPMTYFPRNILRLLADSCTFGADMVNWYCFTNIF